VQLACLLVAGCNKMTMLGCARPKLQGRIPSPLAAAASVSGEASLGFLGWW